MDDREYEYSVVSRDRLSRPVTRQGLEDFLNAEGVLGWQLCAIDYDSFIFKREVKK